MVSAHSRRPPCSAGDALARPVRMDLRPLRRRRRLGLEPHLPVARARGNCRPADGSVAAFRAQQPLRVADAVEALRPFHAPLAPAKGFVRWSSAAAFAIERTRQRPCPPRRRAAAGQPAAESARHLTREEGGSRAACAAIERPGRSGRCARPSGASSPTVRAFPDTLRAVAGEAGGLARPTRPAHPVAAHAGAPPRADPAAPAARRRSLPA